MSLNAIVIHARGRKRRWTGTRRWAALCLSEATVKTHLAHIFTKLNIRDRAQAVVAAYAWVWSGPVPLLSASCSRVTLRPIKWAVTSGDSAPSYE
jgi:Bacterial regulatory proteins, luxR family